MSEAIRFLHALAQVIATMNLYSPGHPATDRSLDNLWHALQELLAISPHPVFFFLGTAPVYNGRPLQELREWQHSQRLADAGVQRLELDASVTAAALATALDQIMARLATGGPASTEGESALPGIKFGPVAVRADEDTGIAAPVLAGDGLARVVDLTDELDAMEFVLSEATRGVVARAEVDAIARILERHVREPEIPEASHGGDPRRYHVVYPVNTALITMVAAMSAGVDANGRRRLGATALLHDIGMCCLPAGLGDKSSLTATERALVETHAAAGAHLLLDAGGPGMELAAVVAFEHHLRPDGTGYPTRRFRAAAHWASRLIGSCSAYASLRLVRPYRPAWSPERAARHLDEGAGTLFDAEAAKLVGHVVRTS